MYQSRTGKNQLMLYLQSSLLYHHWKLRTLFLTMQITRSTDWQNCLRRKDIIQLFSTEHLTARWDLILSLKWPVLMTILVLINIPIKQILMVYGEFGTNPFSGFLLRSLTALSNLFLHQYF